MGASGDNYAPVAAQIRQDRSVSDIDAADERAILDQLRKAQDAHHGGDLETSRAVLDELFAQHGEEAVKEVRWRQAND